MKRNMKQAIHFLLVIALTLGTYAPLSLPMTAGATAETLVVQDIADDGVTAQQLAQKILGDGVQARQITDDSGNQLPYFVGSTHAGGIFSGGTSAVGLKDGVILSSGKVKDAVGPSALTPNTNLEAPGDSDLTILGGGTTNDASVLQFEFKLPNPAASEVEFKFVLASDEYEEFVDDFFDIMGLYINGTNVAFLPDGTTPVSVGNVNQKRNTTFYTSNTSGAFGMTYDGKTVVLTAKASITPGDWNKIKLAIADYSDSVLDSAVFIGANSLKAPTGLKASNKAKNGFSISWDPVEGVTGYDVYTVDNEGDETFFASTATTNYTFVGLSEYTMYNVTVKSRYPNGDQSGSAPAISYRTADGTAPTAPSALTVLARNSTSITLGWTASEDTGSGVSKYVLYQNGTAVTGGETNGTTTTYTFTGLTTKTAYSLSVGAVDGENNTSTKTSIAALSGESTPPTAPKVNIPAVGQTTTSILVSWTAATDDTAVSEYRVYKNLADNAVPTLSDAEDCSVDAPRLACRLDGLTAGTNYKVTVVAVDPSGNMSPIQNRVTSMASPTIASNTYTNEVVIATVASGNPDTTAPNKPGTVTTAAVTAESMRASWTASTGDLPNPGGSGLSGYVIELGTGVYTTVAANAPKLEVTFTDLVPNTSYTIRVCAVDNAGNYTTGTNCSSVIRATLRDSTAPKKPAKPTVSEYTESGFKVTWAANDAAEKATGYEVYADTTLLGTTEAPLYFATGLVTGKTYRITIRAYDAAGNKSAASDFTNATLPDSTAPSIPLGLVATEIITTVVNLEWTASTDNVAVQDYLIFRGETQVGISTTNSFSVTGLTRETAYTFSVKARDAAGNISDASESLSVTTVANSAPPSPPETLYAEGLSTTQFQLSWDTAEDDIAVTAYEIYYTRINDNNEEDGVDSDPTKIVTPETLIETRVVRTSSPNETLATVQTLSTNIGDLKNIDDTANVTDIALTANQIYVVRIKSVDSDGQKSAFSEALPVLVEANSGPVVTVTKSKGDLTRTGVSSNYDIGATVYANTDYPGNVVTTANVKCVVRSTAGVELATLYPATSNPVSSKKRNLKIGKQKCSIPVNAATITNGTYFLVLTVEHPTLNVKVDGVDTTKKLRTKVMRTFRVDKTDPKITGVSKSNDIYGPSGRATTTIKYSVDDEAHHTVSILDSTGKAVRSLTKKTKQAAGNHTFVWNGKDNKGQDVPDGRYTVYIRAVNMVKAAVENSLVARPAAAGKPAVIGNRLEILVENKSPAFSRVGVTPQVLTRKTRKETVTVSYMMSERSYVKVDILDKDNTVIRTVLNQITTKDPKRFATTAMNTFRWDGKNTGGTDMPDGVYTARISAVDIPPTAVADACATQCGSEQTANPTYTNVSVAEKPGVVDVPIFLDGVNDLTNFDSITTNEDVAVAADGSTTVNLVADGTNRVNLAYKLPEYATVTTIVTRTVAGKTTTLRTLESKAKREANKTVTTSWDGKLGGGSMAAAGNYTLTITAADPSGKTVTRSLTIALTLP